MKWTLRLYPQWWRRRYGDEMSALLEEIPGSPGAVVDLLKGAVMAHLEDEPVQPPGLVSSSGDLAEFRSGRRPLPTGGLAVKALTFGAVVCLSSWVGLLVGAGNVGLQQSLSLDPVGFTASYPLAVALCVAAAFATAFLFARLTQTPRSFALVGALAVLLGDAVASFTAAPAMVGELEVRHGFIVLIAISLYGMQVVAAWAGATMGAREQRRSAA